MSKIIDFIKMLGPGLLFAGAAVGTSHLYWSTKAGADFGFAFLWAIVLVLIFKYPFFEFGTRYTASKGETLLSGYKRIGKGFLWAYIIITPLTMFTIQAAVTSLTAYLIQYVLGISWNVLIIAALLLLVCMLILYVGRYTFLDNLIKYIIIILTISTFVAVLLAFKNHEGSISLTPVIPSLNDITLIGFVVSLMGWMPAPVDMSVWNSVWTASKQKATKEDFDFKTSILDFNVGYWSTLVLAILFLSLGALVMYQVEPIKTGGQDFSAQLFKLYASAFGESAWAFWLVGIAALTTMFSTTLTCLDALPRVMGRAVLLSKTKLPDINTMGTRTTLDDIKSADFDEKDFNKKDIKSYWIWMFILVIGTMVILIYTSLDGKDMGTLLKIATILSFLTTPFYALINYKLIMSEHTPEFARPGLKMKVLSWLGIVFLSGAAIIYLFVLFKS